MDTRSCNDISHYWTLLDYILRTPDRQQPPVHQRARSLADPRRAARDIPPSLTPAHLRRSERAASRGQGMRTRARRLSRRRRSRPQSLPTPRDGVRGDTGRRDWRKLATTTSSAAAFACCCRSVSRLFLQREGPGSEPGNSLWHPEVSLEVAVLLYGVLGAFSVERAYCITSITSCEQQRVNSGKTATKQARSIAS